MIFADAHFLIVDDHAFVRRVVAEILKSLGATKIETAADGGEALAILSGLGAPSQKAAPLCVLTDFEMPNVDGVTLLKTIRMGNAGVSAATPVLMLTGSANDEATKPALALDVSGFVAKPASRNSLMSAITRAFAKEWEPKPPQDYAAVETG